MHDRACAVVLCLAWVAELVLIATPVPALALAGAAALAAFLVLAAMRTGGHIRALFLVVVAASAAMAWWNDVPQALWHGFERAQIFGAFLPSVLLLRATVEASPRLGRLRDSFVRLDAATSQNSTLYGSHVLGAVLNVGAMSILAPVVARDADGGQRRLLASSSVRGVGTAVMWSPFFVAIALSSQQVPQAPAWQVMAVGVGLTAIGLVLSHLLYTPALGRAGFLDSVAQLRPLVGPTIVIVASVVGASVALGLSGLQAVAVVVPAFCVAYAAALGGRAARRVARRTFESFAKLADELFIVVGATILAVTVSALPAVQSLGSSVTPGMISGVALMASVVFTLVALGLAGLHPMIGIGILLPVLAAGDFGIHPAALVATAVFSWGLSASISMWTLPLVSASIHFGVPVRELLNRRSLAYGLLYAIGGILYLGAVNAVLGSA